MVKRRHPATEMATAGIVPARRVCPEPMGKRPSRLKVAATSLMTMPSQISIAKMQTVKPSPHAKTVRMETAQEAIVRTVEVAAGVEVEGLVAAAEAGVAHGAVEIAARAVVVGIAEIDRIYLGKHWRRETMRLLFLLHPTLFCCQKLNRPNS